MRRTLVLSLVLATGCLYTHRNTGRFEISWSLVDANGSPGPTCGSHQLGDVLVVATNVQSRVVTGFEVSCTTGVLLTKPLPLGDYELDIQAMGNHAELAGEVKLDGTLADDEDDPRIAATIQVAPPTTQLRSAWVLSKQGMPASCADLDDPVIQVVMTPDEGAGIAARIWRCTDTDTTIDVTYGPFSVMGVMADRHTQQVLANASPLAIAAARGPVSVELSFDVP